MIADFDLNPNDEYNVPRYRDVAMPNVFKGVLQGEGAVSNGKTIDKVTTTGTMTYGVPLDFDFDDFPPAPPNLSIFTDAGLEWIHANSDDTDLETIYRMYNTGIFNGGFYVSGPGTVFEPMELVEFGTANTVINRTLESSVSNFHLALYPSLAEAAEFRPITVLAEIMQAAYLLAELMQERSDENSMERSKGITARVYQMAILRGYANQLTESELELVRQREAGELPGVILPMRVIK
jgi:hypothetical protein